MDVRTVRWFLNEKKDKDISLIHHSWYNTFFPILKTTNNNGVGVLLSSMYMTDLWAGKAKKKD